jgi:hypothetical protein
MAIDINPVVEARMGAVLILQQPGSSEHAHSECVLDHFRCPDISLDFSLTRELSSVSRHLHFDQNVTCYGRTCKRDLDHVATSRYDALSDTVISDGTVYLPFDPDEVIDKSEVGESFTEIFNGGVYEPSGKAEGSPVSCMESLNLFPHRQGRERRKR